MIHPFRNTVLLLAAGTVLLPGQELTPRELFFAAPAIKAKASGKPALPSPPKGGRPAASGVEVAKAKPPIRPDSSPDASAARRPQPSIDVIPAAFVTETPPLGLRYSLMLSRDNGPYKEVDSAAVFHSGDRLKVTVESNDGAHLYVLNQGSSGLWNVLFPSSEVSSGDNFIQPFRRYELPPGGRWYFNEQAGVEKLFVVLSRKPIPNFEDLIYAVSQPAADAPTSVRPASGDSPRIPKTFQVALNRPIDDSLISKVRNQLIARDLVFEKVDDSKPASPSEPKESATYVVNKNAGPDGKVILDLKLEHK